MSKKFLYNPIIGSYEVLNKSYNRIKAQGHALITNFREHLLDDDIKKLLHIKDVHFESFKVEIFDLEFFIRIEINLVPEFNAFKKGNLVVYNISKKYLETDKLVATDIWFKYDEEGRLFFPNNDGIIPDYKEMGTFVPDFLKILIDHIVKANYITVPNASFEGD